VLYGSSHDAADYAIERAFAERERGRERERERERA
jgi:hypothetical protein